MAVQGMEAAWLEGATHSFWSGLSRLNGAEPLPYSMIQAEQ